MAVVYKHTRLDTDEVFYIGIGKTSKRAYSKYDRNIHWKRITAKTEYSVEILYTDLEWEEACLKEIELISYYGRVNLKQGTLCNMTDGGEGKLGAICSEETKLKMSLSHIGMTAPNKGVPMSEETKQKMSESFKGRISPNKGKTFSDETRLKMSNSKKGIVAHNKGIPMSDETKLKMSESGKKAWEVRRLNKLKLQEPKQD